MRLAWWLERMGLLTPCPLFVDPGTTHHPFAPLLAYGDGQATQTSPKAATVRVALEILLVSFAHCATRYI